MTTNEKDEMIKEIMVNHNTTMAATAALMHLEAGIIMECEVSDEDFVWPSG
jgi:hypothetical protein